MCESDLSNQMVRDELKRIVHDNANYWQQIQNIGWKYIDYILFFGELFFCSTVVISLIRDYREPDCSRILGVESFGGQLFCFVELLLLIHLIASFIYLFVLY
eukprot:UN11989